MAAPGPKTVPPGCPCEGEHAAFRGAALSETPPRRRNTPNGWGFVTGNDHLDLSRRTTAPRGLRPVRCCGGPRRTGSPGRRVGDRNVAEYPGTGPAGRRRKGPEMQGGGASAWLGNPPDAPPTSARHGDGPRGNGCCVAVGATTVVQQLLHHLQLRRRGSAAARAWRGAQAVGSRIRAMQPVSPGAPSSGVVAPMTRSGYRLTGDQ